MRQARHLLAADLLAAREDAGLSMRLLARAAGVSATTVGAIEREEAEPSLQIVARVAAVLGLRLSVRLYPGTGPLIRDHLQARMLGALIGITHERWVPRPEVPVHRPVRGVIDLVLDADDEPLVACEAHSELRRLEQQARWSRAKADALHASTAPREVGRLLLLRSTVRTRAIVAQHPDYLAAAYPARAADAYASLAGEAPWPGDTLLWCRVEGTQATILERPPRGVTVGR